MKVLSFCSLYLILVLIISQQCFAIENANVSTEVLHATFDSVSISDERYPLAFAEIQKLNYREKNWDQFFGYAAFYRGNLLKQFYQPDLLVLEVLALVKHCQYEPAKKVLALSAGILNSIQNADRKSSEFQSWLKRQYGYYGSQQEFEKKLIETVADHSVAEQLLELQLNLAGNVQTVEKKNSVKAFTNELLWQIKSGAKHEVLSALSKSPNLIRVFVKDACEKNRVQE